MRKEVINGARLAEIRRTALTDLWNKIFEEGGFRGRTWGKKGKGVEGEYCGSHILLGSKEGEVVILTEDKNGKIIIHEFSKTDGTKLGNEIKELLKTED